MSDRPFEIDITPLSVNKAFQGRRYKTQDYKDFEKSVYALLPKDIKHKGYVQVDYLFKLKHWKRIDIDNCIKPFQDLLVKAGIIEDDRKIMLILAEKQPAEYGDAIRVRISPWRLKNN